MGGQSNHVMRHPTESIILAKRSMLFWIMKDDSLPPIIKINDPVLAASFGATLTKRSDAENITTKDS